MSPELLLCVFVPSIAYKYSNEHENKGSLWKLTAVLFPSPSLESSEESPVKGMDLIWLALPLTVAYTGTGMSW